MSTTLAQTKQVFGATKKVSAEVTETVAGIKEDPTAFDSFVAFKPSRYDDEPGHDFTNPEWHPAVWESANRHYFVTILVGPQHGGVNLARGRWHVFVGLSGPVEVPLEYAGVHTIR